MEQHRWARAYLWALIHGSGKKTPRRLAREDHLPAAAARGLHQFINASSWDWRPVRRRLAQRVAAAAAPYGWTVAELIIPKSGGHSVGVHRRVDPVTGQSVNCQRALGLFLAGADQAFPVDWSLVLTGAWDWDPELRRRARIPEQEKERPVGAYVLDYAADVATLPRVAGLPWILDLTRCEDATGVLVGLARRQLDVVAEVDPGQVVIVGQHTPTVRTVGGLMGIRHARQPQAIVRQPSDGRAKAVTIHTYTGTVRLPQLAAGADGASRPYRILERSSPDGRHGLVHLAQAAAVRGYTPGSVTSPLVVVPFTLWARRRLRRAGVLRPAGPREAIEGLVLAAAATAGAHLLARRVVSRNRTPSRV